MALALARTTSYLGAASLFICLAKGQASGLSVLVLLAEAFACINIPRNIPIPINASTDKRNHRVYLGHAHNWLRVDEGQQQQAGTPTALPSVPPLFPIPFSNLSLPILGNLRCT